MNSFRLALFATSLGLLVPVSAQQPETKPSPATPPPAQAPADTKAADGWIRDLGSDSYRKRIEAERELRKLGTAALPALKLAAERGDDPEVQWRAARVVRQIEGDGKPELTERGRGDGASPEVERPRDRARRAAPDAGNDPVRDQFEHLFEQFERDFGIDVPRGRFFGDGFFRDLQDQLKQGNGRSQGMSVQIGPDGAVHVEVDERNEKGEVEKKVYDAPDLETFRREHPGVLQQNGFGIAPWRPNMRVWSGPVVPGWRDQDVLQPRVVPFGGQPAQPMFELDPAPAPIAGRRLGITIRPEISPDLREHLELPEGAGLMVDGVQDDSLAKALGLQRGDIVYEVAGRTIQGTRDVQEALAPIEKGHDVEVKFVRKGQRQTAKAAKQEPAAPFEAKGKLEKRSDGGAVIR